MDACRLRPAIDRVAYRLFGQTGEETPFIEAICA